ncbi:UDP-glucose 6-dehydrogenase YwqF [compost metagenome]
MNITILGTGYVGLVSGVCYAEMGNQVICIDNDINKIDILKSGQLPIYEPGLKELTDKNIFKERLSFSTESDEVLRNSDIIFIAVGTPPLPNGEANLESVFGAAHQIAKVIKDYTVVVVKSTVPVGTNDTVEQIISQNFNGEFNVVSAPEFLREGSAVHDTLHPDRIIIGTDDKRAIMMMRELYKTINAPMVITDRRSAEMIKYASNAFLATKISFINEIANICEKVGADVEEVAKGMGMDKRIGNDFLKAGIGYGGSCFPKDTKALIQIAGNVKYDFKLLKSVVEVNQMQRLGIIDKLYQALGSLSGKKVAIWGLSFKPGTDDIRESPAIDIIGKLLSLDVRLRLYDPVAMGNFRKFVDHPNIEWCLNAEDAATGCNAICLLTEWKEFSNIDLKGLVSMMEQPVLIDGRNVYSTESILESKIQYYPVGRPLQTAENSYNYLTN